LSIRILLGISRLVSLNFKTQYLCFSSPLHHPYNSSWLIPSFLIFQIQSLTKIRNRPLTQRNLSAGTCWTLPIAILARAFKSANRATWSSIFLMEISIRILSFRTFHIWILFQLANVISSQYVLTIFAKVPLARFHLAPKVFILWENHYMARMTIKLVIFFEGRFFTINGLFHH